MNDIYSPISENELTKLQKQLTNSTTKKSNKNNYNNNNNQDIIKQIDKQYNAIQSMKQQQTIRDSIIETLKERINILEYDIELLNNNKTQLDNKLINYIVENNELKLIYSQLNDQIVALNDKNNELLSINKSTNDELNHLQKIINTTNNTNESLQNQIELIKSDKEKYLNILNNLENKLTIEKTTNFQKIEKIEEIRSQDKLVYTNKINDLNNQLDSWMSRYKELQEALNIVKDKFNNKDIKQSNDLNELKMTNSYLVDYITSLTNDLSINISNDDFKSEIQLAIRSLDKYLSNNYVSNYLTKYPSNYQSNQPFNYPSNEVIKLSNVIISILKQLHSYYDKSINLTNHLDSKSNELTIELSTNHKRINILESTNDRLDKLVRSVDSTTNELVKHLMIADCYDNIHNNGDDELLNKLYSIKSGVKSLVDKLNEVNNKSVNIKHNNDSNEIKIQSLESENLLTKKFYEEEIKIIKSKHSKDFDTMQEKLLYQINILEKRCLESDEALKILQQETSKDFHSLRKEYDEKLKKLSEDNNCIQSNYITTHSSNDRKVKDLTICVSWLVQQVVVSNNRINELVSHKKLLNSFCRKLFGLRDQIYNLSINCIINNNPHEDDQIKPRLTYNHSNNQLTNQSTKPNKSLRVIAITIIATFKLKRIVDRKVVNTLPYQNRLVLTSNRWILPTKNDLSLFVSSSDCYKAVNYIVDRLTSKPTYTFNCLPSYLLNNKSHRISSHLSDQQSNCNLFGHDSIDIITQTLIDQSLYLSSYHLKSNQLNETVDELINHLDDYKETIRNQSKTIEMLEKQLNSKTIRLEDTYIDKSLDNTLDRLIDKTMSRSIDRTIDKSLDTSVSPSRYLEYYDKSIDMTTDSLIKKSDNSIYSFHTSYTGAPSNSYTDSLLYNYKSMNESVIVDESIDSNQSDTYIRARDNDLSILYQQVQEMTQKLRK